MATKTPAQILAQSAALKEELRGFSEEDLLTELLNRLESPEIGAAIDAAVAIGIVLPPQTVSNHIASLVNIVTATRENTRARLAGLEADRLAAAEQSA